MKKFEDINAVKAAKQKYLVYKNQVLDVEGFDHPGSVELIEDNLGKDVTELFDQQGHSSHARSLMEKLKVGYI
jgi:cytochrome b involved in lipid metabolism